MTEEVRRYTLTCEYGGSDGIPTMHPWPVEEFEFVGATAHASAITAIEAERDALVTAYNVRSDEVTGLMGQLTEAKTDNAALRAMAKALDEIEECELFEDGVAADLHDAKIDRLPDAYMAGRNDVIAELRAALTPAPAAPPEGGCDHAWSCDTFTGRSTGCIKCGQPQYPFPADSP